MGITALCFGAASAWADNTPTGDIKPMDGMTLQAVGTETGTFSSNPLLSTTGSKSLFGSTTSPELIVNDTTPTTSFNSDTTVSENVFNQSTFNSTDVHEGASLYGQGELWKIGSGARVDYDTTRTSELTDFGLNNVVSRHLGLEAAPQVTYSPTQLDSFALAGNVQQSTYASSQFTGYDLYTAAPTYTHHFDPMNDGLLEFQAQRYQTLNGPSRRLDSLGPSVGWQTTFSPRLSANVAVGAQTARQYTGTTPVGSWTWDYTFSAGLSFKGLQDTLGLTATRQQFPYGDGTDSLQSTYALTGTHALNSQFSLNYGVNYITSDYQVTTPNNVDTLTDATAGLTYHATEHLDISATYDYRYETLTESSATANDNSVMLTLAYRPKEWTL